MSETSPELPKELVELFVEAEKELKNPLADLIDPSFILEERLKTFYDPSSSDEEHQTAMIQMAGFEFASLVRSQSEGKDLGAEMRAHFEQVQEAMERIAAAGELPAQEPSSSE